LITRGTPPNEGVLHNLLFTSALGLPLFVALALVSEKQGWRPAVNILSQIAGAVLLALYCFSLPADAWSHPERHAIRFALLNLGLHALVAFAPFLNKNELNGFWQFNKALFLRILTAALYSGVLYLGLALALLVIDNLFERFLSSSRARLWGDSAVVRPGFVEIAIVTTRFSAFEILPGLGGTVTASAQNLSAKFVFWMIHGESTAGEMKVNYLQVDVLIGKSSEDR
jgi:hypothetical protein